MSKVSLLQRRKFLKGAVACSAGVAAWGVVPGLSNRDAFAATGNGTKLLIVKMDGGWDGLQICQPSSGTLYNTFASLRPTLKTLPGQLLTLNGEYGLHPSLSTLKSLYDEGKMLSILNVGYQNMSRSHKDSELAISRGFTDRLSPNVSGFVSRLGTYNSWNTLQAVSVSGIDSLFEGDAYRGIQVWGINSFRFSSDSFSSVHESRDRRDTINQISTLWQLESSKPKQDESLQSMNTSINASDLIYQARQSTTFQTAYPNTQFGRAFRDAEVLLGSNALGTEVVCVRRGGFDTHSDQAQGFSQLLPEFNNALSVLVSNMKAKGIWNNLIVVILSEFGRTNEENGSAGTDHGAALPAILLGGPVNGGIIGSLTSSDLTDDGWLPVKINIVDLYRQIVARMGYDPNAVMEPAQSTILNGIFN